MKLRTNILLGAHNAYEKETEGDNLFECVYALGGVHSISKCGKCEKSFLTLKAMKTDQDYEYLKVSCVACGAAITFGKTKKDGIMFYRRKDGKLDWEVYEKSGAEKAADGVVPPIKEDEDDGSGLPF